MDTIGDLWDLVAILLRIVELSESPDLDQDLPLCLSLLNIIDLALVHLNSLLEDLIEFHFPLSSHDVAQTRDLMSRTQCIRRRVLAIRNRVIMLQNNLPGRS